MTLTHSLHPFAGAEVLAQSLHRPSVSEAQPGLVREAQPVFNERAVRRFTPGRELLRIDRAQVLARTRAQGSGEANQSIVRSRRHLHSPRSILLIGCCSAQADTGVDNLELRFGGRGTGKPASSRSNLTIFEVLARVSLGCLALRQACAARRCQRRCRGQRKEHQYCCKGSHPVPPDYGPTIDVNSCGR
jgi:hypothetical protein